MPLRVLSIDILIPDENNTSATLLRRQAQVALEHLVGQHLRGTIIRLEVRYPTPAEKALQYIRLSRPSAVEAYINQQLYLPLTANVRNDYDR